MQFYPLDAVLNLVAQEIHRLLGHQAYSELELEFKMLSSDSQAMYTRVLDLQPLSEFGDEKNPLWQLPVFTFNKAQSKKSSQTLIPLDTMTDGRELKTYIHKYGGRHQILFQSFIQSQQLTVELLEQTQKSGVALQIWFDAPVDSIFVRKIIAAGYDHIEWVYCPRLLYHPGQVFPDSARNLFQRLTIHLTPKNHSFDSWPDLHTMWYFILWTTQNIKFESYQYQTFSHSLDSLAEQPRSFLLSPQKITWKIAIKSQHPLLWYLQSIADLIIKTWLIQLCIRIGFQLKKAYWFAEFQFQKRILRKFKL